MLSRRVSDRTGALPSSKALARCRSVTPSSPMTPWLVRAGSDGEHKQRFFDEDRVYLTGDTMTADLSGTSDWETLKGEVRRALPDDSEGRPRNHTGQIWARRRASVCAARPPCSFVARPMAA
jgi:hypothetical protein